MSIGWQCPKLQLWVWQEEVSKHETETSVQFSKKETFSKKTSGVLNTSLWIAGQRSSDGGGEDDRAWGESEEIERIYIIHKDNAL